ncbi:hypothetical protein AAMO2058_001700800, partial [Amorphochlora amoebiformis]
IFDVSKAIHDQNTKEKKTHSRYPGASRQVGALLTLLQLAEKDPSEMERQESSVAEILRAMLSTKAMLESAESEVTSGEAEEKELRQHLNTIHNSVEADESFSISSIKTSKQRSEELITRGDECLSGLQAHIDLWREAIREELAHSESPEGDMLGDRGSFGFQALGVLLPMKRRLAMAHARWSKIDIRFGALSRPYEQEDDSALCLIS